MGDLLATKDLAVSYGALTALRGFSVSLAEGAIAAVLGANGAGKSSAIRAIAGLTPARGSILMDGRSIGRLPARKRSRLGIGYVPEGRRLFPGLTVQETLELACFDGTAARRARLAEVFGLFPDLQNQRRRRAWQLSGGQQQMLAIGRALMSGPRLLLMDEPSFGLAPALLDTVLDRLREIADRGTAVLIAEQNAAVLRIANTALILQNGEVVAEGPAKAVADDSALARAYMGGAPA